MPPSRGRPLSKDLTPIEPHPSGTLSPILNTLLAKRVLAADAPLSTRSGERNERYRIADAYLRFWLAHLARVIPLIERGRGDLALSRIEMSWPGWRGRAVEPVIRESLLHILPDAAWSRTEANVSFVYAPAGTSGLAKAQAADALRVVLAVFSQTTRTSVLALRRERYELGRLIRRLAATRKRMVELTVVQYGVTRERLAEIVDTGDGWDVLHLSGHGGPGAFLLEHADGSPDPVDVADLVDMLRPAKRRVKLAVVSACEWAAAVTAQTLRLIGLTGQAEQAEAEGSAAGRGCCCTAWPGRGRRLARPSWPTGTGTVSPRSRSGRRPAPSSPTRWPIWPSRSKPSSAATASR
jgi:CHAT domain